MKNIWSLLFIVLCPWIVYGQSGSLASTKSVSNALLRGQQVAVVVDLRQCNNDKDPSIKGTMVGGLTIGSFLIRPDSSLSFSDNHVTVTQDNKPILQFLRYRLSSDNKATFSMQTLSLPTYHLVGKKLVYQCEIGKGLVFYDHQPTELTKKNAD